MAVALPLPPVVQCAALDIDVAPEQALLEVVATIDSALEHGARLIDVTNISKWEFLGAELVAKGDPLLFGVVRMSSFLDGCCAILKYCGGQWTAFV